MQKETVKCTVSYLRDTLAPFPALPSGALSQPAAPAALRTHSERQELFFLSGVILLERSSSS